MQIIFCRCDKRCHITGDCCVDVSLTIKPETFELKSYACADIGIRGNTRQLVVNSCPSSSTYKLKELCALGSTGEWGPQRWLVSDISTNITLVKNHHNIPTFFKIKSNVHLELQV